MTRRTVRIAVLALAAALTLGPAAARPAAAPAVGFVDQQVEAQILLLQGYVNATGQRDGFVYPLVKYVNKNGHKHGLLAPIWPGNPWTGKPMVPGKAKGDYTYTVKADLSGYTLVGHLSNGKKYTVTGGMPGWFKSERDETTKTGVDLIGEAVMRYARLNAYALPTSAAQADLAPLMWPWPQNPYTSADMVVAATIGDYGYSHTDSGFTLTGHLSGGKTYVVTKALTDIDGYSAGPLIAP